MNIELIKFDPLFASQGEWAKIHEYRRMRHFEVSPDDPLQPDNEFEISTKQEVQNEEYFIEIFHIYYENDYSKLIGTLSLFFYNDKSPSYKGNEHFLRFDLSIAPEFRKRGIGSYVFKRVVEFTNRYKKSLIITSTKEESGKKFLEKMNFSFALTNKQNRLNLEEVDWEMVDRWNKDGQLRNPKTNIFFYDRIPEEIIEQFAKILTETMSDTPLGSLNVVEMRATPDILRKREKEMDNIGQQCTTVLTIEENGDISAFSEMCYLTSTKIMLGQSFTGVNKKYRGRGLAKWVKAALLMYMSLQYPEAKIVKTGNADSNSAILSINERLGFKTVEEKITAQIKIDEAFDIVKTIEKLETIEL